MNAASKTLLARILDRVFPRMPDFFQMIAEQVNHARVEVADALDRAHRAGVVPYPGADAPVGAVPLLFDLAVGGLAWLLGLGAPSTRTIEVVGAVVPPLLGALTAVPVFLIGARLFDRPTGLLAVAVVLKVNVPPSEATVSPLTKPA